MIFSGEDGAAVYGAPESDRRVFGKGEKIMATTMTATKKKYGKTLRACYLGFVTQAIAANFAPLLFLTFYGTYAIPFDRLALISTCFYVVQLVVDFVCTKVVDKIGYRTWRRRVGSDVGGGARRSGVCARSAAFAVCRHSAVYDGLCDRERADRSARQPDRRSLPV